VGEQVAVELGDPEPAGVGAVAVVVQGQERLDLRGPGLAAQQDRLVPDREVVVDRGEHPAGGLPQPPGVGRPTGPGAVPGGPVDQPPLRRGDLLAGRLGRRLLGGVHDHPDLLDPQPAGRERLPRRGVPLLQQPGQPQPARGLLPRGPGQPGQPRIGAGLRGLLGHPTAVRLH
jgi:hypothetical protein